MINLKNNKYNYLKISLLQVINLNDLFIKFIINIEINTIDLKLYEGLDFDFD